MKRKAAVPVLAILFALMLAVGIVANAAGTNGGAGGTADTASSSVSESEQTLDEEVFPKDKVIDVKVTLDEADFQDILDNASAEEYKTASVNYNGIQMDNIGIRAKGNLSLRSVVQMEDSDRYSFKLSFDEYVNQTLDGISKINLNNGYSDASYMREFLTYELADLMGLPTPKFSFVNLYVNGELRGLYLAVEQIGDAYLERNFGNSNGALYKGTMDGSGSDLQWIDDNLDSYSGLALKSDKTDNDILIDMLDELNNGSDYEKYINIDDALGYIALNVLTVNTDSYIGGNKQNYYLYDSNGVFSILPWDYNMAFGGLGGGGSGSSSALMIDEPTQGTLAERPLVAKLLAVDEYKEKYHEMIQEVLDGYLSNDQFSARVQEVSAMISPYVEQDPTSFYTYEEYEQGVEKLISINASDVEAYQSQLDGESAISGDGSGSGGGMGGFGGGGGGDMQPPEGFENMFGGGGQGQGQQAPTGSRNGGSSSQGTDTAAAESQNQAAANNTAASAGTSVSAAKLTTASLSSASSSTLLTTAVSTEDDAANVPDLGNGGPQGGGMGAAPGSDAQGDAQQGNAAGGQTQSDAQQGDAGGAQAQGDTQQGNAGGAQAQGDAQQGNAGGRGGFGGGGMGGMQPPDGFGGGGGGMPGMGGGQDTAQGDPKEAITTVVMLVLLAAASVFVVRFKRKRW